MKLKLFDAVVIAALGLLCLKAIDLIGRDQPDAATGTSAKPETFARVLSDPRRSFPTPDPEFTGSVAAKKDEAKPAGAHKDPKDLPMEGKPVSLDKPGPTRAERELYESLGQRRQELEERARQLDMREKLLETAEKKLETRVGELKMMEDRLTEGDKKKKEAEAQTLKSLVIMYEAMKPKDAARVFDRLPQDVLVSVVTQMNPRKMSEILGNMQSDSAEKLTVALAQRAKMASNEPQALSGGLPPGELPAIPPAPQRPSAPPKPGG
jgi:flagellar motility protein MotE (MotC chaperone)